MKFGVLLLCTIVLLHLAPGVVSKQKGCFTTKAVSGVFKRRILAGRANNQAQCYKKCLKKVGRLSYFAIQNKTKKCFCLQNPKTKRLRKLLRNFTKLKGRLRNQICKKRSNVRLYKVRRSIKDKGVSKPRVKKWMSNKNFRGCFNVKAVLSTNSIPVGKAKNRRHCYKKCLKRLGSFTNYAIQIKSKRCFCIKRVKKSLRKLIGRYRKLKRRGRIQACRKGSAVRLYRVRRRKGSKKASRAHCFKAKTVFGAFKRSFKVGRASNRKQCYRKCLKKVKKFRYYAIQNKTKKCFCFKRPRGNRLRRLSRKFGKLSGRRKRQICKRSSNLRLYSRFRTRKVKKGKKKYRGRKGRRRERCPRGRGYVKTRTGCYAVFHQKFTWPEAAIFCFVEGARLVEIRNGRKNKDVVALAKKRRLRGNIWIAANDIIQENVLRFIGTNRSVRTSLKKGIGNNRRKNCVQLTPSSKWKSADCNQKRAFICERYPRRWE